MPDPNIPFMVTLAAGIMAREQKRDATGAPVTVKYLALGVGPGVDVAATWDALRRERYDGARLLASDGTLQGTAAVFPSPNMRDRFIIDGATYAPVAIPEREWIVVYELEATGEFVGLGDGTALTAS